MKLSDFLSENLLFLVVKFSIYLQRRVFVMFIIPKPNINLFKNSISYAGTIIWNSIPLEIKNAAL